MKRFIALCTALIFAVMTGGCVSDYPLHTDSATVTNAIYLATSTLAESAGTALLTESTTADSRVTEATEHPHDYQLAQEVNPSCTEAGKRVFRCQCGAEYAEPIAALEHDYTEVSRKEPKPSVAGQITYRCTGCAATYNETIPALPACVETDMCGPSLIEKVLPHAPFSEEMREILALYHMHPPKYQDGQSQGNGSFYLSENFTIADVTQLFFHQYRYLCFALSPHFTLDDDGRNVLRIFYDDEAGVKQATVYRRAEEIIRGLGIDGSVTQKEAIRRINEYLCERNYYEYDEAKRPTTLYEAMFTEGNICETYALAFQVLCLTAGIECHYYESVAMRHAWNRVYFSDGSYLWVDVTWNDARIIVGGQPVEAKRGVHNDALINGARSRFLLIDDAQLWKDHTP